MFDEKEYHKNYMQEYRKRKPLTEEQLIKRRESVKKAIQKRRLTDPEWVAKERARGREYAKKRRQDPEYRKSQYKKHTEWARKNRELINARQRERNKDPEAKLKQKERLLMKNYGLTLDSYYSMLSENDYKCPICSVQLDTDNSAVDHNHATGQIRDVICKNCNLGLGFIETKPHLLEPMKEYLARWNDVALQPSS